MWSSNEMQFNLIIFCLRHTVRLLNLVEIMSIDIWCGSGSRVDLVQSFGNGISSFSICLLPFNQLIGSQQQGSVFDRRRRRLQIMYIYS